MGDTSTTAAATGDPKDPRTIARKYQLDLCKRAVDENIIVYLGTGCGKTHIAVLLIYELGHLIRKPSREVCIFLAPTIPLVRQQAMVIANSINFKVQSYYGTGKNTRDHQDWEKEMEEYEEFYDNNVMKPPRIFGMTASPVIGKGGSNKLNYTKCINSLEELLHAKICSVDNVELESVIAFPDMEVLPYVVNHSGFTVTYNKKLTELKLQSECKLRESLCDLEDSRKKLKSLWRLHENLIFCLQELGSFGALQAARTFLSLDGDELDRKEVDIEANSTMFVDHYLNTAISILSRNMLDGTCDDTFDLKTLEEPFFSNKFVVLINVLLGYRLKQNMKCMVFVKRIIIARAIAYILRNLKCLSFWKCEFLVGCHSGPKNMSRKKMDAIVEKFSSGEVNLLVATSVGEEGLDIQTCYLVVRFDLPETVTSFIQSRGRARMTKSKYVIPIERGNQCQQKLLNDCIAGESIMNEEIHSRTSSDMFDCLQENTYRVNSTGAIISTAYSVSLLHFYCDNLPRDVFFTSSPAYFYTDDTEGIICKAVLPPNAAFRQVDGSTKNKVSTTNSSANCIVEGDMVQKTARSFLFELCAASYWKHPEFELWKEEGPIHLRRFTYKVVVQIAGPSGTLLECYSGAELQKKAAQEHAAQGALWCLKRLGFLPKDVLV